MGNRYWVWLGVRLLVALAIMAWVMSYVGPGSGEKDFQRTLDAMKQVHSFRAAFVANPNTTQHSEILWEVDCDRGIVHYQSDFAQTSSDPPVEIKEDEVETPKGTYEHKENGSWGPGRAYFGRSAQWYCGHLAQGVDSGVLPQISTMIKRGILQKGDKKTVHGVRCQEWLVTMKNGTAFLDHDKVCFGLEDHLPYELSTEGNLTHFSYSDYNTAIAFDLPGVAIQPASTHNGSN
jgi:hypothetical protein